MTYKSPRRQKFDGCGTTAIPQSVISKEKKCNNQMTQGMCLCVCCMCSVMREGITENVGHASEVLLEGIENAML